MRIWLIASVALLAGCESDFDKCMNTEVRKAEQMLGLDEELAHAEVLSELKIWAERLSQFENQVMQNIDEGVTIEESAALEISQCNEILGSLQNQCPTLLGLPTEDEGSWSAVEAYEKNYEAHVLDGRNDPYDWGERLTLISSAIDNSRGALAEIREETPRLAAEVCNSRGFYE